MHVSGLFISLWDPANSLFVRENMSRPQESGYMQAIYKERKQVKNIPFDTTARNKQQVRVVQW